MEDIDVIDMASSSPLPLSWPNWGILVIVEGVSAAVTIDWTSALMSSGQAIDAMAPDTSPPLAVRAAMASDLTTDTWDMTKLTS